MSFIPLYKVRRVLPRPDTPLVVLDVHGRVWLEKVAAQPPRMPRAGLFPSLLEQPLVELGELSGELCCGFRADAETLLPLPESVTALDIREALLTLDDGARQLLLRGKPILEWLAIRRYCGVCGEELSDAEQEEARRCPNCGALFFPKISPAVIVLVTRGDQILLAHNRKFRNGIHSLIAGFVEAGESAEAAVVRELREEVGIEVDQLRYQGSQSWPFPDSLMLGFTAEYVSGEVCPDGEELSDAAFYRADALPELPRHGSIARRLIQNWLDAQSDDDRPAAELKYR